MWKKNDGQFTLQICLPRQFRWLNGYANPRIVLILKMGGSRKFYEIERKRLFIDDESLALSCQIFSNKTW